MYALKSAVFISGFCERLIILDLIINRRIFTRNSVKLTVSLIIDYVLTIKIIIYSAAIFLAAFCILRPASLSTCSWHPICYQRLVGSTRLADNTIRRKFSIIDTRK